jgi:hypothetical protein
VERPYLAFPLDAIDRLTANAETMVHATDGHW